MMNVLLVLSRGIDTVNERLSVIADWLVLLSCGISAANAFSRYAFSISSNAWLEIQWYMFAAVVMLGASYVLKMNEHVRVDLVYGSVAPRKQLWIDLLGTLVFLLPVTCLLAYMSWPLFTDSWRIQETSTNAGGLIRWPVKLLIPVGFFLLTLQGLSELVKRIAALQGEAEIDTRYERPVQ
jgi:TRAP-type mannitol/chloroaromatic compound transport system permease small subunit